jgi:hypothetical protein
MPTFLPSESPQVNQLILSLANRPDVIALCRRYAVRSLFLYGSTARGEDRSDSDIDLLVSFSQRVSLLHMVALERELSELLGRQVDLQTEAALSPYIRDRIIKERQQVYAA